MSITTDSNSDNECGKTPAINSSALCSKIDDISSMVQSIDENYNINYVSDSWLEIMGYERKEVIGRPITDFLTEKSRKLALSKDGISKALNKGKVDNAKREFITKDGEVLDIRLSGNVEYDEFGKFKSFYSSVTNVNPIKSYKEEIEKSHNFLKAIINNTPGAIIVKDHNRKIIEINDAAMKGAGNLSRDISIGRHVSEMLIDEDAKFIEKMEDLALEKGSCEFEKELTFLNNNSVFTQTRINIFESENNQKFFIYSSIDITQMKKEEEATKNIYKISTNSALRSNRKIDEMLLIALNFLGLDLGVVGTTENNKLKIIHSYSRANDKLKSGDEFDFDCTYCAEIYNSETCASINKLENFKITPDGSIDSFEFNKCIGSPLIIDGKLKGVVSFSSSTENTNEFTELETSFVQFVTQTISNEISRGQYLDTMRENEKRYELAAQGASAALWDWHINEDKIYWSKGSHKVLGYKDHEHLPESTAELAKTYHPDDRKKLDRFLIDVLKNSQNNDIEPELEVRIERENNYFWTLNKAKIMEYDGDRATRMCGSVIDITHRKEIEEQLKRSNEELEQYASVASHDLQQPLVAINGFLELLQITAADNLSAKDNILLDKALESTGHMSQLIRDMLDYSRSAHDTDIKELINLTNMADQICTAYAPVFEDKDAVINYEKLPTILFNKQHLERVMTNLMENAVKYSGDVKPEINIISYDKIDHYLIEVKDNGMGIAPNNISSIFDMFYRSKEGYDLPGTGIGLAICKKLVEENGGRIWAMSEIGKGTSFFFTVPK